KLASLFRHHGFETSAVSGARMMYEDKNRAMRGSFTRFIVVNAVAGAGIGGLTQSVLAGLGTAAALTALAGSFVLWHRYKQARGAAALLRLRERVVAMPAADRLLGEAKAAAESIRAPDVKALMADVAVELYRLTQRAETLTAAAPGPSSEVD